MYCVSARLCFALATLINVFLFANLNAFAASVADTYMVPTIVVPYAAHRPTLDGVIRDDEWKHAASICALQTTDHAVSARQTRFWIMWDEDNLYVAMRSPLRPGERLIQALRETDHDVNVVFDDSYELWINAETRSPDSEPAVFQYLGNFAGARYDVMQEPAVGNSRISWTAGWNPRNRLTPDGKDWECTFAIPRASIYKTSPFTDGYSFQCLMARNYKRPWEQNTISGSGSFAVSETYAKFVCSKSAPAIQLLSVGDPVTGKFGVRFTALAGAPLPLQWEFNSDGGLHRSGNVQLTQGNVATIAPGDAADGPGKGSYRITITSGEHGNVLLDWCAQRRWGDLSALTMKLDDRGDKVDFALRYNPAHDFLRVTGDMIDYDNRADIARYDVSVVDSTGRQIAAKSLALDSLNYVRGVLNLPDLPAGDYTAILQAYDKGGKLAISQHSPFSKKDAAKEYPWWNTSLGNIDKVICPWTPVVARGMRRNVWGRSMTIGAAGLPANIVTQGRELLTRPSRLVATLPNGQSIVATASASLIISALDYRCLTKTSARLGSIDVESDVSVEFDGMYKVSMTLNPHGSTTLNSLRLIVPLKPDEPSYLHSCGEGIRYGFDYRFLPKDGHGRLWSSQMIDGQPMTIGSFVPYVWLGNPGGGLCWFADSDQGWAPSDKVPAIEVRRDRPGSTDLVLNLIGTTTVIDKPRTITFAFQATPVKPIEPGWRMNTWWTNDSFQDWAQVESQGHAGSMGLIFSSIPFPLDGARSKAMVDARHADSEQAIFGLAKYHSNAVPYFEHINMGEQFVPAMTYFGDDWRTRVSRGLAYDRTLQDFIVYNVSNWARDCGIDGIYLDNVYPIADNNVQAGRGYVLPDGRVQPAYQIFDTRRYLLRMRAALAEQGKAGKFVLHITNHMIAPWIESADIALDGEDHVIYPEQHKDFMDFWSLERLRLDYPGQWGVAVNFLQEYQGAWEPAALKTGMRAYTGMQLLDDTLASANANSLNQELWQARDRFDIEADDVRFLPYWDGGSGLTCHTYGIHVVGWLHTRSPGKVLLAVVNSGNAPIDAQVHLDNMLLGLASGVQRTVTDAETQQPIDAGSGSTLSVPVPRHDYRLMLVDSATH